MNGRLHALSRLGVGSGRDDISGHSPIGLVMVSRHGLLHGATHGLSPRSFPCFPGSVLPRLHGVAPFFRRRGRRPAEPLRPNSPPLTSSSHGRLLLSTLPWKGDKRRLTTRPCNGGGRGRHCNAGRDLGCPAVKSSQGSSHSNGPRRGFAGGLGATLLVRAVRRDGAARMNAPRATARRSCCGSRSGRELRRTTSSACA